MKNKKEMERAVEVFRRYIDPNPLMELFWSQKMGCYILLDMGSDKRSIVFATCYDSPEEFCNQMFFNIAHDAFKLSGYEHDKPDEEEEAEMRRLLKEYAALLPEYEYIAKRILKEIMESYS